MSDAQKVADRRSAEPPGANSVDRFFRITARGSTFAREIRGGFATFFTMAYILVLNPIILGNAEDKYGHTLNGAELVTATALVAAVMTVIMGVGGNLPLALAAGLGLNAVVAFQIAPLMSWPDAMGLVVLEGLLICVLVVTGLREAVMHAIPQPLKQAISVGIGLFIAFIGFVDAGFVSRIPDIANTTVPVQLGATGSLSGWPILVFCLGVLLTIALLARKVRGAILISILAMTVVAIVINSVADIKSWGLTTPKVPDDIVAAPEFGLIGDFSLFGSFGETTVITVVLLIFTLLLSDFFDTMGTVVGITAEAGLLDDEGKVPNLGRVLLIDGAAAVAGGASSASSATSYIESAAGVGEGARTGFANLITGGLFAVALFLTPLLTIVPMQAAAPALVAVGFLMMTQVKNIDWDKYEIAIPAFLTIAVMPFTYSITNGIGAGFLAFVLIKTVLGKAKEVHWLLWGTSALFLVYFAIDPIEQLFGVK
ncbi:NCS2 family permease [Streptomyces ipomoeae]|jgi:AGZA family xanthine/uracil permease-like MFS transporter|uniref:NCS2 family permease n=1 Tax=Streptomyces ipomoeae TaxID=103232 RepID=A0A540P7W9_9ACTN|nr:NCS2 family permease [Streptomyces ipomoeae]MDX2692832.1 NCS2 family permease [Streptomyces ipomoeae]MDX2822953.1 NCS2 family permease [Streptomyces ipomoeae]MDX2841896.1 NCS2 family permease [Streptomyces ipomoeae]MDX2872977.1 NCS2 family permease [Streptomyces ipomoeae]MDX2935089.1 NCS2 family permease [Streptomyces ipomoeae]